MANLRRIRRFFQITLLIDIELVEDAIEHQLQCASSRHLCWHLNNLSPPAESLWYRVSDDRHRAIQERAGGIANFR